MSMELPKTSVRLTSPRHTTNTTMNTEPAVAWGWMGCGVLMRYLAAVPEALVVVEVVEEICGCVLQATRISKGGGVVARSEEGAC